MPKAFSEQDKEHIRRRLLDEGSERFATYGLQKTNVEELARAAGISKGAFYTFFESKEALFMDVAEAAEQRFREEILALVDEPGPSPRARLRVILQRAFELWRTIPVLQFFSQTDYASLSRKIPADALEQHLATDHAFVVELIARCRAAGIPIQADPGEMLNLLYAIFFTSMHEHDFGPQAFSPAINILIELVAAYCLGEVEISAS